jgi:predicted  nucleic acid-binding Zn-ribbon protein
MDPQVQQYITKTNEAWASTGSSVDRIVSAYTGLQGDITRLKDTIKKLQDSPGTVTPEDQKLLDESQQLAEQLSQRATQVADALKTLDDDTAEPPVEPPTDDGSTGGEGARGIRR